MGEPRQGGLKLFFDRCVGKNVPLALRQVGFDVVYFQEEYSTQIETGDEFWIAEQTTRGRLLVTMDKRIRTRPAERARFVTAGARAIFLNGQQKQAETLRQIVAYWTRIEAAVASTPAPFIYYLHPSGKLSQIFPES